MPSYTSLRNEGNGRNYQSNFHGTLEQVISDWKTDCARQDCIWSVLIEEPTGKVVERFNPTNTIEEPNMQEFLNTSLKPYDALTREEKHLLLDAVLDGNCERQASTGSWVKHDRFVFDTSSIGIYRTKPKEYKKLDIPWQHINELYKYATMDAHGWVYLFAEKPRFKNDSWDCACPSADALCLQLDTTRIVAEHSLTERPE